MIVKMSRLRLAGLKSDYEGVIDILTSSKQFEYRSAPFDEEENKNTKPASDSEIEQAKIDQSKIGFAIDYLNKLNDEAALLKKKAKKAQRKSNGKEGKRPTELPYEPFKKEGVRKLIDFDTFSLVEEKKRELMEVVDAINKLSFACVENRTKLKEQKDKLNEYSALIGLNFAFSDVKGTKFTNCALYFTSKKNPTIALPFLADAKLYKTQGGFVAWTIFLRGNEDEVDSAMSKNGFSKLNYTQSSIGELVESCEQNICSIEDEMHELMLKGLSYEDRLTELMILYDLIGIRADQRTALDESFTSAYTFILDGWVPEANAQKIVDKVAEKFDVYYTLTAAEPKDEPPTLIVNNKLVEPFENITKMYTVPAYTEKDPNVHMAIWYFILFGVMCGDVVYGLMLTIGCVLLLRFKKFEKGTANMIKMFAICGISSALWGVVFDSYLGYGIGFGWFVPMDKPMLLLGLSLVLGVLQIAYGYVLGIIRCIRERNPMAAIFDMGLMLVVLIAISLLTANIFTGIFTQGVFDMSGKFLPDNIASIISKTGLILLLVAVIGIFLTAGRSSKSIGGKIGNGLYGVYGLVNLVSDILSYCRLFGLGLAGGAIAYAFNTLMATIFFAGGSIVGFIIGAVLSLVLHVFNLAISLLGAYVHNARLQMLEFYGKFLLGDGREFSYIGQSTKYVRF